jgi:predicted Zn-dependent protease
MLPTPDAASIAFAEVTSFIGFFIEEAGESALRLLLADLKGIGARSPEPALRSVTGYGLSEWNARWQRALSENRVPGARPHSLPVTRDAARRSRLSDLLLEQGRAVSAAEVIDQALDPGVRDAPLRFRSARAQLDAGDAVKARQSLGTVSEIGSVYGAWFGLQGRFLREQGDVPGAERAFGVGIAVDPLSEDVACEGERAPRHAPNADPRADPRDRANAAKLPASPERSALCRAARDRLRH